MAYEDPQAELEQEIRDSSEPEEELSDFEKLVAERFPAPESEPPSPTDSVEQPEGESPAPPPPESYPDTFRLDDDVEVSRETLLAYHAFEQFLEANPKVAEAIQQAVVGEQAPPSETPAQGQTPAPQPSPTPDFDLENPEVKWLLERLESQDKKLADALESISRHDAQLTTQSEAQTKSIVDRAAVSFAKERGLTEEQVTGLRDIAASMNVMEGLLSPIDPVSHLPRKVDPLAAVEKALEIAYWSVPEYREKEIERRLTVQREDTKRQSKLSSLGGSSGSTPREQPAPQTKKELQDAMIREVAGYIGVPPSS